jgi:hypothetical protein
MREASRWDVFNSQLQSSQPSSSTVREELIDY